MSIQSKIESYKQINPELKQTTLRISQDHLNRIKKYAKDMKLKEGVALRLLVEDAIERIDGRGKHVADDPEITLREEVTSLRKQLQATQQVVEKLCSDLGGNPEESLSSVSSKGIEAECVDNTPSSN